MERRDHEAQALTNPGGGSAARFPLSLRAEFMHAHNNTKSMTALLQSLLRLHGYNGMNDLSNTGPVDGKRGPLTEGALGQFKREKGLAEDTEDRVILEKMRQGVQTQEMRTRMEQILETAQSGVRNEDVRALQTYMKSMGMNVKVDGLIGPQTRAAFLAYKERSFVADPGEREVDSSPERLRRQTIIHTTPGGATDGVVPTSDRDVTMVLVGPESAPAPAAIPELPVAPVVAQPAAAPAPVLADGSGAPVTTGSGTPVMLDMGEATVFADQPMQTPAATPQPTPAQTIQPQAAQPQTTQQQAASAQPAGAQPKPWWERGQQQQNFNRTAQQGWPFNGQTTAVQPAFPQMGNKGGLFGSGIHVSVNSRGQWGVRARF
jgi:hypothetical protein